MAVLGQKRSLEAHFWTELKLGTSSIQCKQPHIRILLFGGSFLCPKIGLSAKITWGRGGGDFGHEEVDMNVKDGTRCALDKLNEIGQVSSVSVRPQTGANSCPWLGQI